MRNKIISIVTFAAVILFVTLPASAQDSINSGINNTLPEPSDSGAKIITPLSRYEFTLSLIVLAFGLIIILLEIFLIRSKKISSEDTIKFIIITLIITSTLFLITAGYSNDQIAPAVGLLGTIAGYLLGRIQNQNKGEKNESPA
jgi:asparagine N-glycosylation enzyme membrane subunit Stt3